MNSRRRAVWVRSSSRARRLASSRSASRRTRRNCRSQLANEAGSWGFAADGAGAKRAVRASTSCRSARSRRTSRASRGSGSTGRREPAGCVLDSWRRPTSWTAESTCVEFLAGAEDAGPDHREDHGASVRTDASTCSSTQAACASTPAVVHLLVPGAHPCERGLLLRDAPDAPPPRATPTTPRRPPPSRRRSSPHAPPPAPAPRAGWIRPPGAPPPASPPGGTPPRGDGRGRSRARLRNQRLSVASFNPWAPWDAGRGGKLPDATVKGWGGGVEGLFRRGQRGGGAAGPSDGVSGSTAVALRYERGARPGRPGIRSSIRWFAGSPRGGWPATGRWRGWPGWSTRPGRWGTPSMRCPAAPPCPGTGCSTPRVPSASGITMA